MCLLPSSLGIGVWPCWYLRPRIDSFNQSSGVSHRKAVPFEYYVSEFFFIYDFGHFCYLFSHTKLYLSLFRHWCLIAEKSKSSTCLYLCMRCRHHTILGTVSFYVHICDCRLYIWYGVPVVCFAFRHFQYNIKQSNQAVAVAFEVNTGE